MVGMGPPALTRCTVLRTSRGPSGARRIGGGSGPPRSVIATVLEEHEVRGDGHGVAAGVAITSKLDTSRRITDGGVWECRAPVLSWATRLRIRVRLSLM